MEQHMHEENVMDIDPDDEHSSASSAKEQGSDDEQATPEPNLTEESQKNFERAAEMADRIMRLVLDPTDEQQQQQGASSTAALGDDFVSEPVQRRRDLVKYLKELMESNRAIFAVPLYLDRMHVFLQDQDTNVLSTALTLCYELNNDDNNEKAYDYKLYYRDLVALFKASLWAQARDMVQTIVGQNNIGEAVVVIIITVISIHKLIELMMTTYGAGLSEATRIRLLESAAASLIKYNLVNILKNFSTMSLFVNRTIGHIPDFYDKENTTLGLASSTVSKIVIEAHLLAESFIRSFKSSNRQQRHQLVSTVLQDMPGLVKRCGASLSAISAVLKIIRTIDIAEYEANSGFSQLFPALIKSMTIVYKRTDRNPATAWEITTTLSNWRLVCLPSTLNVIDGIITPCGIQLLVDVQSAINQGANRDASRDLKIYGMYAAKILKLSGRNDSLFYIIDLLRQYIEQFCNPTSTILKSGLEAVAVVVTLLELFNRASQPMLGNISTSTTYNQAGPNHPDNNMRVWNVLRQCLLPIVSSVANAISHVDRQQAYQLLIRLVTLFLNHPRYRLTPIPPNIMAQLVQFVRSETVVITTQIAAIKTTFPSMTEQRAMMLWDADGLCPERLSIMLFLKAVSENIWNLDDAIFVFVHLNRLGTDIQLKATNLFSCHIDMAADLSTNAQFRRNIWSRIFFVIGEVFKQSYEDYIVHVTDSTRPAKDLATVLTKEMINYMYTNADNSDSGYQDGDLWQFHQSALIHASDIRRLNAQRWDDYFLVVNKLPFGKGAPPAGVIHARSLFPLGDANGFPERNDYLKALDKRINP
ncbi:MAG: hypothetical protein J3R72DRAFT_517367 [Linnemannia gamsii]|nr:MAG: hypothetical protein J3R72DRAFT_517367 [Linnemannia gamsii]